MYHLVLPSVNISTEIVAVQGNTLTLDCNPIGQPAPTITWFRGGVAVQLGPRLTVDSNGRLTFTSIFTADEGTYRCVAQNTAGMASADTALRVIGMYKLEPYLIIYVTTPTYAHI